MAAWGFTYKTNLVWYKMRKDGGPDGRGVGFYFRNVTELVLFGVRGRMRTLAPGRSQVNVLVKQKREHSRKPDEFYEIIERCSPGPYLELFARDRMPGWTQWGDQVDSYTAPNYPVYTGSTKATQRNANHETPVERIGRRVWPLPSLTLFAARGTARMRVGDDAMLEAVKPAERNPWTNLDIEQPTGHDSLRRHLGPHGRTSTRHLHAGRCG